MSDLFDSIRQIVRQELRQNRLAELAVIQEQHPHADEGDSDNYSCTVALRDSDIVLRHVPVMVTRKGIASIPDVGDLVMVQFLNGDINAPIIVGSLYNDEDRPPANSSGSAVWQLPLGGGGIEATISTEESASVEFKVGESLTVTLLDDDPAIKIELSSGVTLEVGSDGSLNFSGSSDIELSGASNITIEAAQSQRRHRQH